ncbi:MAG TPA: glycosyltransferase [Pseudacidobacterium sp.]|jgi:glycosyltransferase involved in cell wall biosynthesis|nr:glycosyltransferase [Pseudacidobacterium sp.]
MPTIGLSMIVKNGGEDLRRCLTSARPVVDQIVIGDTGSTDDSHQIAQEFGTTVVEIPWTNHYAEARNACLQHMTTDWVLVLDADEELSTKAGAEMPKLIDCSKSVGGFRFLQRNYQKERFHHSLGRLSKEFTGEHERAAALGAKSYLDNPLCRLFRKDERLYFHGRIHELIERQIIAANLHMPQTELVIHHFGALAESRSFLKKHAAYRDLLRLALKENPNDSNLWVQLGISEKYYFQQNDEALKCYQKAAALHYPKADAWIGIAQICKEEGEHQKVLDALSRLKDVGDVAMLKCELSADALHSLGRLKEARVKYASALRSAKSSKGHREACISIESKLGYTEVRLGMHRAGIAKMRRAVEAWPTLLENHDRLVKALVFIHRETEAADAAEAIFQHFIRKESSPAQPR